MYISLYFFSIFSIISCSSIVDRDQSLTNQWELFKSTHGKKYENANIEQSRMKIFLENKLKIEKHNELAKEGKKSYYMGMNRFGDLQHNEFVNIMNGYKSSSKKANSKTVSFTENVKIPTMVDWRAKGYVTQVKDQGHCGSCWSFSAVGALEGQHFKYTGDLVSLSEQNLIDCSSGYGNNGCNGGLMNNAFQYINDNRGIDTEDSYPYEAIDGVCRFSATNVGATDTGFVNIPTGSEKDLDAAIATVGPISVAIDASQYSFQFYTNGTYDEPNCSSKTLDHGVLAVGYGPGYYLVKNSWGTSWGENGYIKMSRGKNNQCGIATMASYPTVK